MASQGSARSRPQPTAESSASPPALDLDLVVDAAGAVLDAEGPEALTLTRVAEELGVTQPALYRHVDGLPGLWRALGLSTRAALADCLAEASVGRTGHDAVAAVAAAWRDFALVHPGRYRTTDRFAVSGDPALEEAVHRTMDVLERSLRGFDLAPEDVTHAAQTLRSALHGFAAFELGHGNPADLEVEDALTHMVDHLCAGFDAKRQASERR